MSLLPVKLHQLQTVVDHGGPCPPGTASGGGAAGDGAMPAGAGAGAGSTDAERAGNVVGVADTAGDTALSAVRGSGNARVAGGWRSRIMW